MHLSFRMGALRLCVALAASFSLVPAHAASLEVAPTKLTIDGKTGAATLNLANRGSVPIIVQLESFVWSQADGKDVLKPTDDVLVSPPMARIPPGGRQTVRIMVRPGGDAGVERTYRLFASELPDPATNEAHTIRVLLQFNVPLFVNTPVAVAPRVKFDARPDAKGIVLNAQNSGRGHEKFTKIEVVTQSGRRLPATSEGIPYLLAGATRPFRVEGSVGAGEKLTVEARTDSSEVVIRQAIEVQR
jgi:fimbrial chaperone protein